MGESHYHKTAPRITPLSWASLTPLSLSGFALFPSPLLKGRGIKGEGFRE